MRLNYTSSCVRYTSYHGTSYQYTTSHSQTAVETPNYLSTIRATEYNSLYFYGSPRRDNCFVWRMTINYCWRQVEFEVCGDWRNAVNWQTSFEFLVMTLNNNLWKWKERNRFADSDEIFSDVIRSIAERLLFSPLNKIIKDVSDIQSLSLCKVNKIWKCV